MSVSTATWYHIVLVRDGNDWDIYKDGVSIASLTDGDSIGNLSANIEIGTQASASFGVELTGYLDDLRVTKGEALWDSDFTPPVSAVSSGANTKLLLHMDGNEGSTTFTDETSSHTVNPQGNAKVSGLAD